MTVSVVVKFQILFKKQECFAGDEAGVSCGVTRPNLFQQIPFASIGKSKPLIMDSIDNPRTNVESQEVASGPRTQGLASINRRDWLRLTIGGGVGLAVGDLLDLSTVRAATQKLKLANVTDFTTSCDFCSCGCGMIAAAREGKLIAMEGDYDHILNRGSLCVIERDSFPRFLESEFFNSHRRLHHSHSARCHGA